MIERTLAQYRILEQLGAGGMGEVWLAEDTVLDRKVALKFLPQQASESEESKRRFMNEARAAAALDHPNIGVVHEVGEAPDGQLYIAMAYYGTETLKDRIQEGPFEETEALEIARQIARGLEAAHGHGLIHRDIKPANIMITEDGTAKIVDFGLVRVSDSTITRTGTTLGTIAYASPEQITGREIDHRTDLWSLGVVLYELLTGERPFVGETEITVSHGIVSRAPDWSRPALTDQAPEIRALLKRLLEKDPGKRPDSTGKVADILEEYLASLTAELSFLQLAKRRAARIGPLRLGLAAAAVVLVVGALMYTSQRRAERVRHARTVLLPAALDMLTQDRYAKAFFLAREAQQVIPADTTLVDVLGNASAEADFTTEPSGAVVKLKGYFDTDDSWHTIGRTPLTSTPIPVGPLRFRIEHEGYSPLETFDVSEWAQEGWKRPVEWHFRLQPADSDTTMVRIPSSPVSSFLEMQEARAFEVPDYLLGRFEVTNSEYQHFVDAGGYNNPEYWEGLTFKDDDGQILTWQEACSRFVDSTGFPGPSTWAYGRCPENKEDHPVAGVSWYEAAAYARFAGKELPTLYHWSGAVNNRVGLTESWNAFFLLYFAGPGIGWSLHYCTELACVDAEGTLPVGASNSLGPNGVYDLVGNVREWCWNETEGGQRILLGKAHSDPFYGIDTPDIVSSWDRSPLNGIRLASYPDSDPAQLNEMRAPVAIVTGGSAYMELTGTGSVERILPPETVSEDVYQTIAATYRSFVPVDLEPAAVDTLIDRYWIRRRMEISTYYGARMGIYIFTPRNLPPPYQTIICHGGQWGPGKVHSADNLPMSYFGWLPQRARAFVYPVWYGTFERGNAYSDDLGKGLKNQYLKRKYLDLVATLDYLESSESDLDLEHVAYMGYSEGASIAPPMLVLESRLKAAVLMGTGNQWYDGSSIMGRPDIFLPHITLPILLLNGRYDCFYPPDTQLKPFFELLGTPEEHKRMAIVETNHGVMEKRFEVIQIISEWLDTYLGPVGIRKEGP